MTSRHQAALSFLHNISLDGNRQNFNTQAIDENKKIDDNTFNDSSHIDHHLISDVKIERINEQQSDEVQAKQIIDRSKFRDKQRLRLTHVQPVALSTTKCLPYAIFSVIPYSKENILLENSVSRQRQSIVVRRSSSDMQNLAEKPAVSYRSLLTLKSKQQMLKSLELNLSGRYANHWLQESQEDSNPNDVYHPYLLDDPELRTGKHRVTLRLPSMMFSVLQYSKASDVKKDLNERFKGRFPTIELTLSKLRSLKRELYHIAVDLCSLEVITVAYAYVYFEKLILKGKINKPNRKLIAGAALLLAVKMTIDIKQTELAEVIDQLQDSLRINRKDLIIYEFDCLVGLEFSLEVSKSIIAVHYQRIIHENA